MLKYNIIYTSPEDDAYLWNGSSLDKLAKTGQEGLFFSGKAFKEAELTDGLADCKMAIEELFPDDDAPDIKTVEVKVSN